MTRIIYKLYKKINFLRLFLSSPKVFIESYFVSKNIFNTSSDIETAFKAIALKLSSYHQLSSYLFHNNKLLRNKENFKLLIKSLRDSEHFNINKVELNKKIDQICIIGNMGIGNFLHLLPLLRNLKKKYPGSEIVVIFTKKTPIINLVKIIKDIDRCLVFHDGYDKENLYCFEFLDFLKYNDISPDIIFTRFTKNFYAQLLNIIYPKSYRIGHCSSAGFHCPFTDFTLSHHIKMDIMEHEIKRNLNLLKPLNSAYEEDSLIDLPKFEIPISDKYQAERIMRDNKIYGEKIIFICPGTSLEQTFKRWSIDNWIDLIILLKEKKYKLVLLGSKDDEKYSNEIITQGIKKDIFFQNIVNLCGLTTINELFCILPYGSLFIGLNSGMTHIANVLGIKSISLMMSTDNPRTNPYYNNSYYHQDIDHNKICISVIPDHKCWDQKFVTNFDKEIMGKLNDSSHDYACINNIKPSDINKFVNKII